MKVEDAKEKHCPMSFSADQGIRTCAPAKCMWWIDEGEVNDKKVGQCAVTGILQALYDTRRGN